MKTLNPYLLITGCLLLTSIQATFAQDITPAILNSSGGSVSKGVSLEWSIGEMTTVNSTSTSNLLVNAGILQGQVWQSARASAIHKPTITPNPLVNTGYLQYQEASRGTITCDITDASGKMLRRLTFAHPGGMQSYRINTQGLPAGALNIIVRFTNSTNSTVTNTDLIKVIRQ